MWPKLVANKMLKKKLGSNNFVAGVVDEEPVSTKNTFFNYQKHQLMKYRVFVSTWNVGGVSPNEDLSLQDWLDKTCDIYVFGFQEIVALKASNILGPENRQVSMKWNSLIGEALNHKQEEEEEEEENPDGEKCRSGFKCIVSKQMVGIMISVWARTDLLQHISTPHVSCIPCGLMGFLPNKGSASVRFGLHGTSFCFVCTHLASGGRDGDRQCRNDDVAEILSRTKFPNCPSLGLARRILDHESVIMLGDLNYRIGLPEPTIQLLVNEGEWDSILENDQLRVEMRHGGVLEGWQEGMIAFPPTYKYCLNSNQYVRPNRRAPAWCDRIIWCGDGLKQVCYKRGESNLSDHRPVKAVFTAQVSSMPTLQGLQSFFLSPILQ